MSSAVFMAFVAALVTTPGALLLALLLVLTLLIALIIQVVRLRRLRAAFFRARAALLQARLLYYQSHEAGNRH